MKDRDFVLLLVAGAAILVALWVILAAIPYLGPVAHAAGPLHVVATGRTAHIAWQQPPEADTAIVLRQRQPQLVDVLRLIAGPQQVEDDETQAGDIYWIAFWDDSSYVETSGFTLVRWEQRLVFP